MLINLFGLSEHTVRLIAEVALETTLAAALCIAGVIVWGRILMRRGW